MALPLRGQLDDLNKARVNFEHNGQLPTMSDAIRFSGYTQEFLSEAIDTFMHEVLRLYRSPIWFRVSRCARSSRRL
jgi:hypothetical protein